MIKRAPDSDYKLVADDENWCSPGDFGAATDAEDATDAVDAIRFATNAPLCGCHSLQMLFALLQMLLSADATRTDRRFHLLFICSTH